MMEISQKDAQNLLSLCKMAALCLHDIASCYPADKISTDDSSLLIRLVEGVKRAEGAQEIPTEAERENCLIGELTAALKGMLRLWHGRNSMGNNQGDLPSDWPDKALIAIKKAEIKTNAAH